MSFKSINPNKKPVITPAMEDAIMKAFEEMDSDTFIKTPQKEHLEKEFNPSMCCSHQWKQAPIDDDVSVWYQKNFDEECEPGMYCTRCGAVSLWENGRLWAFDSTVKFFGRVKKEKFNRRQNDF